SFLLIDTIFLSGSRIKDVPLSSMKDLHPSMGFPWKNEITLSISTALKSFGSVPTHDTTRNLIGVSQNSNHGIRGHITLKASCLKGFHGIGLRSCFHTIEVISDCKVILN